MQTTFNIKDETGYVHLDGDLNVVKVDKLREELLFWLESHPEVKNVVLDLSDTPMIDSAGLGLLILFLKKINERGGQLHLAHMQKRVSLVFDITRTKRIFKIYPDVDEAEKAFD